jgi:hypothetical protein
MVEFGCGFAALRLCVKIRVILKSVVKPLLICLLLTAANRRQK